MTENSHAPHPAPAAQPAPPQPKTPAEIDDLLQRLALGELANVLQMMRASKLKILAMGSVPEPHRQWIFEEACAIAALVNKEES